MVDIFFKYHFTCQPGIRMSAFAGDLEVNYQWNRVHFEVLNWLYVLAMSRTRFRVNPRSIVA